MAESIFLIQRQSHAGLLAGLIADLLAVLEHAQLAERLAQGRGLLQAFDPRVRLIAIIGLIGLTLLTHHLTALLALFVVALALTVASRVPIDILVRGVWPGVLMFTGSLALPAVLLVPGSALAHLPLLGWSITAQGVHSAVFLVGRGLTSASLTALLILTTPWPQLLKALRVLGLPAVLIAILGMTYRYLFVLLYMAQELIVARQSRQVGRLHGVARRHLLIDGIGTLLGKAMQLADEVFLAMQSRGYRGEHPCLAEFALRRSDWVALAGIVGLLGIGLT